ncbi:hypothetical protein BJX76DRAFT_103780 [Aspergillus varians]
MWRILEGERWLSSRHIRKQDAGLVTKDGPVHRLSSPYGDLRETSVECLAVTYSASLGYPRYTTTMKDTSLHTGYGCRPPKDPGPGDTLYVGGVQRPGTANDDLADQGPRCFRTRECRGRPSPENSACLTDPARCGLKAHDEGSERFLAFLDLPVRRPRS